MPMFPSMAHLKSFCTILGLKKLLVTILQSYGSVAYQLHETAGELLKTQVFASPSRRLRGYALIGSDRKNRKRQNSTSKQM